MLGTEQVRPDAIPGYQQVEYIESSGTQRIDTGIKVANDITYGFECEGSKFIDFGCIMEMGGSGTDNRRYGITYADGTTYGNSGKWEFGNHGGPYGWGNGVNGYGPIQTGGKYILQYNLNGGKTGTVNGTTVVSNMTISNYNYTSNWNIFCQVYGSNYVRYGSFRLHYMKIYHGSTLVRDFIPVYRKSDSVIGLWDKVNNQFYTNSGSGTFTKGPNVN